MRKQWMWLAAALALGVSARASAHELTCTKQAFLLDVLEARKQTLGPVLGGSEVILNHYPATVGFLVTITNPLSTYSDIKSAKDLNADLDFNFGQLVGLNPGQSICGEAYVTFETREECLAFANDGYGTRPPAPADPQPRWGNNPTCGEPDLMPLDVLPVCEDVDNVFQVTFDGGLAQCRARIVCGEEEVSVP